MSKAHDKQIRFVFKVLGMKLTDDVALAAIWFRDNKAWHLTLDKAVDKFKSWIEVTA